jgi:hypothetical protein
VDLQQPESGARTCSATIGRVAAERTRWRVVVEAWPDDQRYCGRLVFTPDAGGAAPEPRTSAALLHGRTAEEVVSAAYDLPEKQIRALLHSLS